MNRHSVQPGIRLFWRQGAVALLLIVLGSSALAQPRVTSNGGSKLDSGRDTATKRHLTTLRASQDLDGLKILIGASSPISDAVAYRSGDRYVVVIPQAELSALQVDMKGLTNFHVGTRDDDVTVSFNFESGTEPQLTREDNQIVVTFRRGETDGAGRMPARPSSVESGATNVGASSQPVSPPQQDLNAIIKNIEKVFKTTSVDVANLDLNTPESPAFTVLGLTPQTVVRPASPREFASSLINGLDKNGNFQSGLAIDTAPYLLFNGRHVTLEDYNRDRLTRFLTRTQFSFAAAKGSSADDPTTRLSLGLNLTLYDAGDPRVYREGKDGDVLTCFDKNLKLDVPPVPPRLAGETDAQREQKLQDFRDAVLKTGKMKDVAEQCREEGRKKHWNKSSWIVAFAPSWISKTGNSSDFKWNGGAVWTSYAHGVGDTGQFILHGRFRNKEQVPDPAKTGSFITQDSAFFGGRFRVGNPDFGLNVEGLFVRNMPESKPAKNTYEFSVAAEKKISSNVYFVVSAGSKGPQADNTKSHGFVITSFKYGFSKKPQIATPSN